jgi:ABC-type sulfate/molybdate transport systems ATPase subunit
MLYRTFRVLGTTVISAPASRVELGLADRLAVLDRGRVVQEGLASEVYASPVNAAAAMATGEVNLIPVTIRGNEVESPIGAWNVDAAPFQGDGVALVRPDAFAVAATGEESDLIFSVEEASFHDGRWHLSGLLRATLILRVTLPGEVTVHKGKLLALRYDARRFTLTAPR